MVVGGGAGCGWVWRVLVGMGVVGGGAGWGWGCGWGCRVHPSGGSSGFIMTFFVLLNRSTVALFCPERRRRRRTRMTKMNTRVDPGGDEGHPAPSGTFPWPTRGHPPLFPVFLKLKTVQSKENQFFSYLCQES